MPSWKARNDLIISIESPSKVHDTLFHKCISTYQFNSSLIDRLSKTSIPDRLLDRLFSKTSIPDRLLVFTAHWVSKYLYKWWGVAALSHTTWIPHLLSLTAPSCINGEEWLLFTHHLNPSLAELNSSFLYHASSPTLPLKLETEYREGPSLKVSAY